MQISAVLITRNEARRLPHALESLAGVADEILVVDSGPTAANVRDLRVVLDHFQRCCIARRQGRHSCLPLESTDQGAMVLNPSRASQQAVHPSRDRKGAVALSE